MFHLNILPEKQVELYKLLKTVDWLKDFYLAGGTGLALHIGHRQSIDFDFFTSSDIDNNKLDLKLSRIGVFKRTYEDINTLYGELNDVKLSFIKYDYPLLEELASDAYFHIAGLKDISAMKLSAILSRGTKKDFVDMFFLLKSFSLKEILGFYSEKFKQSDYEYTLLRSLLYFQDAENDPMPRMIQAVKWEQVKKTITKEVRKLNLI
ncbi:MAG: nucleotidyl transferase AbiEii/AbiGii toxin family protein [Bacteroidota bacterium]|nr:nucleotidyl transferase AbiEii/AbiGii toxin family protein [Bacteroidota bacterium]